MENLNEKQMEEMLPDYLFGKLDANTAEIFKNNLSNFPSIEKEYKAAKEVFQRIEELDINKAFDKKAMNLSVRVNNRLNKKSYKSKKYSFFGYAVPIATVITMLIVFFNTNRNTDNVPQPQVAKNSINQVMNQPMITVEELTEIIDEDLNYTDSLEINSQDIKNQTDELNAELEVVQMDLYSYDLSESALIDELEQLDESEFQLILNDIKDNY